MLVVSATCLMLIMRGGARENVESQLGSLTGFRQLTEDYKGTYCTSGKVSVTEKQRKRYESARKVMKSQMAVNPIEAYLKIGGPDKGNEAKVGTAFVAITGFWLLMFIMAIMGCCCYCCCCICDKCCCPCKCCRRDYNKKPIT